MITTLCPSGDDLGLMSNSGKKGQGLAVRSDGAERLNYYVLNVGGRPLLVNSQDYLLRTP